MNDLVRWEPVPYSSVQNSEQVGVYTFYLNREESSRKLNQKPKTKKKKSKSSLSGNLVKKEAQTIEKPKKKRYKQVRKKSKGEKPSINFQNPPAQFLKNILGSKHQRSFSKFKIINLSQNVQSFDKLGSNEDNNNKRSPEPNLLKRCRTSFDGKITLDEKEQRVRKMRTDVLINFLNSPTKITSPDPVISSKVINLNVQNKTIFGPELVYEEKNISNQKAMPSLPQIKKPHIQKCIKIMEQRLLDDRSEHSKLKQRSKSTIKAHKNRGPANSFAFTKSIDLQQIHQLKIIQLGRHAQNRQQIQVPEDKKGYLRRMGFKF